MRYAFFGGCNIPHRMPRTAAGIHALMRAFSVEMAEVDEFTCCGYPVKNLSTKAWLVAAARNLALAEKKGLDMLVLCACCHHSLRQAAARLAGDSRLADEVNEVLAGENLEYRGRVRVDHALSVLNQVAGPEGIAEKVARPMDDHSVACHYGCHLLRPGKVMGFDDPFVPEILDRLVSATGARPVEWDRKMDCCGAPVLGTDRNLALNLAQGKLASAADSGAGRLCTVCPYCHLFFEDVQKSLPAGLDAGADISLMNYAEFFCEALGIEGFGEEVDRMTPLLKRGIRATRRLFR